MRNRAVVALEEVLGADLPVRLVFGLGSRVKAKRVNVDARRCDAFRDHLEGVREGRRRGIGVDEDEWAPRLEPERNKAELLALDTSLAVRPRSGQEPSV